MFRSRYWMAAVVGGSLALPPLLSAAPPTSSEPGRLPISAAIPVNQQMSDAIAKHLQQSGRLRHYAIDVTYQQGIVDLTGTVADQAQREEAVRLVQGMAGVEIVRDRLSIQGVVSPIRADDLPKLPPPIPGPIPGNNPGAPQGQVPEPAPIFQGPPMSPFDLNPPKMPANAWPTYAPYNNYSRVAYPQSYPYNSWPYIGPMYPFPKIPPGWRSVKLEWQDGHWWFSSHATKHDFWRLRYW